MLWLEADIVRLLRVVYASPVSETPDIFISYARSSETHAKLAATALNEIGYRVWWDEDLPAHRAYGDVIEERLAAAKAVLVIWSRDAAKSQWVRAEADAARKAGKLVQLNVDGTPLPMPFDQIQCPLLSAWSGERHAAGWAKIEASIAELLGRQPGATGVPSSRPLATAICVLPFANSSGDPNQEYLSDGITEDLITDISKIPGLAVVARTTSFTFKGGAADVRSVARQLNVTHVVEGSVRKSGDRLRITAQLVDGATGHQLWGERYDREAADIFDIQDEISQAVVAALKVKLAPTALEVHRQVTDPIAYQEYLKGRHCWNRGTEEALRQAVSLFSQAVERDPAYARAYAGLADTYVQLGSHTYVDPKAAYSQARLAAEKALAIDPELPDAHASLGLIAFVHDWDAVAAEMHLKRAVELDPSSATTRQHYSRILVSLAQHDAAVEQARTAVELDPLSVAAAVQLASALSIAGRAEESIEQLRKGLAIFPNEFRIYYRLVFAFGAVGQGRQALDAAEHALQLAGRTMFALGALGYAKACAGQADDARRIAREMEEAGADRYVCPFDIAAIYAALNDTTSALAWLREALRVRDHAMLFAKVDPALANLRGTAEFQTLLEERFV